VIDSVTYWSSFVPHAAAEQILANIVTSLFLVCSVESVRMMIEAA
jgi:hypothetical protein